jgi:hypothetical protein
MTRRWWRRNAWGLLLVMPLAAGMFALNTTEIYRLNFASLPKRAVPVDSTGKAVLDDYAVRVVEVVPVENSDDVKDLLSSIQAPLPTTVEVWRAILSFAGPKEISNSCTVELLDGQGRAYTAGPSELVAGPFDCVPDDNAQPSPYVSTSYFLLPTGGRPTAVRVVWEPRLPRYIRIPVTVPTNS